MRPEVNTFYVTCGRDAAYLTQNSFMILYKYLTHCIEVSACVNLTWLLQAIGLSVHARSLGGLMQKGRQNGGRTMLRMSLGRRQARPRLS